MGTKEVTMEVKYAAMQIDAFDYLLAGGSRWWSLKSRRLLQNPDREFWLDR